MRNNYNNLGLKFFYIYQITAWLLGINVLLKEAYQLILNSSNLELLFICALLFFLSCFIIYINFCLLFNLKKNKYKVFLIFNKWIIFIQIFQISLFGFAAYFTVGMELGIIYSYRELQTFNFFFKIYRFDIGLNYHDSSAILVAINFIPIFIFMWLNKIISKMSSIDNNLESEHVATRFS